MRMVDRRIGETTAEHDERAYGVAPSQAEDRIEVIIAETVWRDDDGARRTLHESREIVRDATGKPSEHRSRRPEHRARRRAWSSTGRWVEVLTPERPTAEDSAKPSAPWPRWQLRPGARAPSIPTGEDAIELQ